MLGQRRERTLGVDYVARAAGLCAPRWTEARGVKGARLPEEFIDNVPLDNLRLDPDNPRLPRDMEDRSQPALLRHFARRYNLLELARSIADKGFAPRHAEALLVTGFHDEPSYVAVEGNRRLATLLLLTSQDNRRAAGTDNQEWTELAEAAAVHDLTRVPVILYDSRSDILDYLGFRHITGPAQWRPEAKARFIAELMKGERTVRDVARAIGSNARTVRRFAEAYAIYQQAATLGLDLDRVEAGFGVFYNALDTPGVRQFIGLEPTRDFTTLPEAPVPMDRLDALEELFGLLFGDSERDVSSVLRESRELKELNVVLLDREATAILRETRDLGRAFALAGGGKLEMVALLRDAYLRLAQVNGRAREFRRDEEVRDQVELLKDLVSEMAERYGIS